MADLNDTPEATKDRPASPGSSSWTVPSNTQENQVSPSRLDVTADEAVITTGITEMADRAARTFVSAGQALGLSNAELIDAVQKALRDPNEPVADYGLIAEIACRVMFPTPSMLQWGTPSPTVERAVARVIAGGGLGRVRIDEIVIDEQRCDGAE
jgi:hypothetical protein